MSANGLIIAAPRSGSGKTVATLAILSALRARGMAVRAAKAGPDFIDPAFHAVATGAPSVNLDSWAMPPALLDAALAAAAGEADLLLIEAAMGLFDGAGDEPGRRGSAADLATRWSLPVVLVLDVSGQAQSVAAIAHGFGSFDPAVRVAGVILNRVASPRHYAMAAAALRERGIALLGSIGRDPVLALPERHLGLVQAREHGALPSFLATLAATAEREIDLGGVLAAAVPVPLVVAVPPERSRRPALPPPGRRIALADDAAFSFIYPHLLAGWQRAGAAVLRFSPLADQAPPDDADCCWLPGGYPELHAERLAATSGFLGGLRRFSRTRPVHGECGGYMVLGRTLVDAAGTGHAMAGLLDHSTSFAQRRMHLGYRSAALLADGVLGPANRIVRGHEFHYAQVEQAGNDQPLARLFDAAGSDLGPAGGRQGLVSGSFFHAIALQPEPELA